MSKPIQELQPHRVEIVPRTFLWLAIALGAGWLLIKLLPVVLVVVVALFLVGTFGPAVDWLEKRAGWRRSLAVIAVFGALFSASLVLAALILPSLVEQVRSIAEREPEIRNRVADALAQVGPAKKFAESLRHFQYDSLVGKAAGPALVASTRVAELLAYVLSTVFLALYFMLDRDRLRGGLFASVPRRYHVRLSRVVLHLELIVGSYIRGQALTSALMAVFTFALLLMCGVSSPLALSLFAGLTDVLPYVGGALAIAPAAATASTQGVITVVIIIATMLAYQEFESRVLVPRIYGRTLRLPSSMVLLGLLAGGTLGGILGALLALPTVAALRMIVVQLHVTLPGESDDHGRSRARDEQAELEYAARVAGLPIQQAAAIAMEISALHFRDEP